MKRAVLLLCLVPLWGCAVGSKAIRGNYNSYNQTIAYNQSQQMLLNLVRLKYRETPVFLKVGALSTSYDFSVRASAGTGRAGSTNLWDVDLGPSFSERPTITYTPIEGETFVKQVIAEVESDTFVLLLRSGWPIKVLGHLLIERVGPWINNEDAPTYDAFKEFVAALQEAQDADELHFVRIDDRVHLQAAEGDERFHLPGIHPADEHDHSLPVDAVQLRSFLDILFFLGKNTQVPKKHTDYVKHSEPNGWINIQSSIESPEDVLVSVRHRGYYFSIANSDIQSKDTFALIKLLFQMQAGDIKSVQPILTLPVSAP